MEEDIAAAIVRAVESKDPPLRLILGGPALQAVRAKLDQVERDMAAWRQVSIEADFPGARMPA